jgi:aminoglycoside phosphotransferase family enzyme
MKRLPAERMLDRLLADGLVDEGDIRGIARVVGEFHLGAERSKKSTPMGASR